MVLSGRAGKCTDRPTPLLASARYDERCSGKLTETLLHGTRNKKRQKNNKKHPSTTTEDTVRVLVGEGSLEQGRESNDGKDCETGWV